MIQPARFFGFGTNIARREYPIIDTAGDPIKEFESVKCSVNFGQTIQVPYFTEIDQCDYVELGDKWYYITNVSQATNKNNSLDVTIRLSVPTTLLFKNSRLTGDFNATPSRYDYNTNVKGFTASTMKLSSRINLESEFDNLITRTKQGEDDVELGVCWVQITANTPSCPIYEITDEIDQSSLNTYGFPCVYYRNREELCNIRIPIMDSEYDKYLNAGGHHINSSVWMQIADTPFYTYIGSHWMGYGSVFSYDAICEIYKKWLDDNTYRYHWNIWDSEEPNDWVDDIPMAVKWVYPSMNDIVNNPDEALGIPASSIMDMSISMYCPYEVESRSEQARTDIYGYAFSDIPRKLMTKDGSAVGPDKLGTPIEVNGYTVEINGTDVQYAEALAYYGVDGGCASQSLQAMTWKEVHMEISEVVHDVGSVELKDDQGNTILQVPNDYLYHRTIDNKWMLSFRWRCWNDNMGVYVYVDILHSANGYNPRPVNLPMVMPCGKLPYMGDRWNEYRVYDMANDRDALNQATLESVLGAVSSLVGVGSGYATDKLIGGMNASNAATKAMPVVGAISQVASTGIGTAMSLWSMNEHQKLKERATKRAPGTGYQTGYGFQYLFRAITDRAGFYLYIPNDYYANKLAVYRQWHGYENEGVKNVSVVDGHIEGSLYSVSNPKLSAKGPMMTELIELIASGINLRIISKE